MSCVCYVAHNDHVNVKGAHTPRGPLATAELLNVLTLENGLALDAIRKGPGAKPPGKNSGFALPKNESLNVSLLRNRVLF